MRHGLRFLFVALPLFLLACGGDTQTPAPSPPAAPTDVRATLVENGIRVTWTDNSDDEAGFRIHRDDIAELRSEQLQEVGSVAPDTTAYRDATARAGVPYRYSVAAYNSAGESDRQPHQGDPVTVAPPPAPAMVRLSVAGTGEGTVTSTPAGIACGDACVADFGEGTIVTLRAAPAADATFGGWSGACSGSDASCTITLDGSVPEVSVGARFGAVAIVVTSAASGSSETECTLRDAIDAANRERPVGGCPAGAGADTIVLPLGATIRLLAAENDADGPNGLPSIQTQLAIVGNGATITRSDAAEPFRIFHLGPEADLTLRDMVISNGFDRADARGPDDSTAGGAIYNRGKLLLEDVTVRGNRATGDDDAGVTGGIYSDGPSLTLLRSSVSNNSSNCFVLCNGGVSVLGGNLEIRDSVIEANFASGVDATDGVGLLIERGEAFVATTRFEGNAADADDDGGGAIAIGPDAVVEIVDSEFIDNAALYGGAIWSGGTLTLRNSRITGGSGDYGGAINNSGALEIVRSTVDGSAGFTGGGLVNHGTATLSGTTLSGCAEEGGAIFNSGELRLVDDSHAFNDCDPDNYGIEGSGIVVLRGGVVFNDGSSNASASVVCTDSRISGGRSFLSGGGVENQQASFRGENCIIEGNETNGHGGGIHNTGEVRLSATTIRSNVADLDNDKSGSGGGIYHEGAGDLYVLSGSIIGGPETDDGNSARTGGGVFIGSTGSADFLAIDDSAIVGNAADSHGGGIYFDGSEGSLGLDTTEIRGNTANIDGGGIYILDGAVDLYGTTVTENIADVNENGTGVGGGLYVAPGGAYRSENARIENNVPDDVFTSGSGDPSEFEITLRFGAEISEAQKRVFRDAAARWAQLITEDVPDFDGFTKGANACRRGEPAETSDVDDVVIYANIEPIDGPGSVLGSAGPCYVRTGSGLPIYGTMRFDSADMANLEAGGTFPDVILHEMGHVLGIGSLWDVGPYFDLVQFNGSNCDASTGPIGFTGGNAGREYGAFGGSGLPPVESDYGAGTKCSHWDEETFDDELMTGFVEAGGTAMPASRLTAGSLQDMGYGVAYAATDAYAIPSCSPSCLRAADGIDLAAREIVLRPLYALSPDGERIPYEEFVREGR